MIWASGLWTTAAVSTVVIVRNKTRCPFKQNVEISWPEPNVHTYAARPWSIIDHQSHLYCEPITRHSDSAANGANDAKGADNKDRCFHNAKGAYNKDRCFHKEHRNFLALIGIITLAKWNIPVERYPQKQQNNTDEFAYVMTGVRTKKTCWSAIKHNFKWWTTWRYGQS